MEEEIVKITKQYVINKYKYYNKKIFMGELPEDYLIPFKITHDKRFAGRVKARRKFKDEWEITSFEISDLFEVSEKRVDATIIHEMIHVLFISLGNYKEQHGPNFLRLAKILGDKVGFTIPKTEDVTKLKVNKEHVKSFGAVIWKKYDNTSSFRIIPLKDFNENINWMISTIKDLKKRYKKYANSTFYFLVTTSDWIKKTKAKKLNHKLTFQEDPDGGVSKDIMRNGVVVKKLGRD